MVFHVFHISIIINASMNEVKTLAIVFWLWSPENMKLKTKNDKLGKFYESKHVW